MGEERAAKRIKTQDGASSSAASGSTYEVFLSFRGADIRLSFTDHLYGSLRGAGIRTFRDNEELRVGEEIGPDLMKAIEESSISLPIFSKGYASSKWCLREVTHMVKCMNDIDPEGRRRHTVCPIFYDVTPRDVKHQAGSFEQAFVKHTTDVDACTVKEWKDALKEVCELKGWERDKIADGHEAELIKKIVTEVCQMLKTGHVILTDKLVGMDYHVDEMTKLMDRDSGNGVLIIGIVGMGGIGKTTIAKFMYNKRCGQFRNQCSFLEDVREKVKCNGHTEVRKQLISDGIIIERSAYKKVLIVLDDVEKRSQFTDIIGGREHFGSGSRIIVTTRNKDVFVKEEGDLIYEPGEMNYDDSLLLFCKHAFKSTQPREGFEDISREVVQKADGLPLFLVVIGSMLFNKKGIKYWKGTLDKLQDIPAEDVLKRLKISYDALDHRQKKLFLDIACHFIGEDITLPCYMWKDCKEFNPDCDIDNLVYLSLITIGEGNIFRMHDQLRDLGRYIVNQENPDELEERGSRLWSHEEAVDTLNNQSGTNKIQTLHIENYYDSYCFSNHDFKGMSNLRYLHLRGKSNLEGDFKGLLPELRWFRWGGYSDSPVAVTNFCPRKLVILDLSSNNIGDDWESSILIKEARNLKVLDISHCNLTKTPDFSTLSKLERLNLEGCQSLTKIGSSVNHLKSLTYFNAKSCSLLRKLPPEFGSMASLQEVHLDGRFEFPGIDELPESIGLLTQLRCLSLMYCHSLVKIPESICNLKSLVELNISKTGITEISESVGMLNKLEVLNCSNCESLRREVPSRIGRLTSLRVLNLSQNKVDGLPEDIGSLCNLRELNLSSNERLTKLPKNVLSLSNLKKLNLSYSAVKKLPGVGIERLQNLEELDCSKCEYLEGQLPEGIGRLSSLKVLNLSNTEVDKLPEDVGGLCNLRELNLSRTAVQKLPELGIERLQNLKELDCSECRYLEGQLPEGIGRLSSLNVLILSNTRVDKLPEDVGSLCNLSELDLSRNSQLKKLPGVGIERLQKLERLNCSQCWSLKGQFPAGIWCLSNLRVLKFSYTKITGGIPKDISGLSNLQTLDLGFCVKLQLPVEGLELPLSLTKLAIPLTEVSLNVVRSLVNLRSLKFYKNFEPVKEEMVGIDMPSNLKKLKLKGLYDQVMCRRLLPALKFDRSSRLRQLHISSCTFETFPLDLSNCQTLIELSIEDCPATRKIKGLEVLTSLKYLTVYGCPHLEKDDLHPDLLKSESLRINWREGPSRELYSESDTDDSE